MKYELYYNCHYYYKIYYFIIIFYYYYYYYFFKDGSEIWGTENGDGEW